MFEEISKSQKSEVIQAKRKVVYKGDGNIENSILWDDRKKQYYTGMKLLRNSKDFYNQRNGELRTKQFDLAKPLNDSKEFYDEATGEPKADAPKKWIYEGGKYVQASIDKDRVGLNEVYLEFKESHFVNANDPVKKVYDGGRELSEAEKPYAIRLYAEGNMDHALGLAKGMKVGASASEIFPTEKMTGRKVAIKATEFRSLAAVKKAYNAEDPEKLGVESATENNLEGSFGGKTGDMTRKVLEKENSRKYDLIQATFFWLQDGKKLCKDENKNNLAEWEDGIVSGMNDISEIINGLNSQEISNNLTPILTELEKLKRHFADIKRIKETIVSQAPDFENKNQDIINNKQKEKLTSLSKEISNCFHKIKQLNESPEIREYTAVLFSPLASLETALQEYKTETLRAGQSDDKWYNEGNQKSYKYMLDFVKSKVEKLKPNGELRIVVGDADPYNGISSQIENLKKDINFDNNYDTASNHLNAKYSNKLKAEGLNSENFKHKQTFYNLEVKINKDLIITVRPKSPEDASSPAQIPT